MNRHTLKANILLLLSAAIWGATFVAQRVSTAFLSPFAFQMIRSLLSAAVLFPLVILFDHLGSPGTWFNRELWIGGTICGVVVFLATNLQQFGMSYGTTAGKSGFITALYIIIVPIIGLFWKKKLGLHTWFSIPLAVCGLYLLCVHGNFKITIGDAITLISALFCAIHIISVGYYSPKVDAVRLCCIQFMICGILSLISCTIVGFPTATAIFNCWFPLSYAVIFSSVIAYIFQAIGQRNTTPAIASLLMSMEAVFACLSGWILLNESLSLREIIGCFLMFGAIVLAQLPNNVAVH